MEGVDGLELFGGILYLIIFPIAVILMIAYYVHMKARLKQGLSEEFVLAAYLKLVAVSLYGIAVIISTILHNFWPLDTSCRGMAIADTFAFRLGMTATLLTWILYLHLIYPPNIGYSVKHLWKCAATVICVNVALLMTILVLFFPGVADPDKDRKFPYYCGWTIGRETYGVDGEPDSDTDQTTRIVLGLIILSWDIGVSCAAIYYWNKPYKTLLDIAHEKIGGGDPYKADNDDAKYYRAMYRTGVKYKMIVTVSSVSEIVWICMFIFLPNKYIGSIFAGVDFLITMIGLMLMTSPNPDEWWYSLLCCLCIKIEKDTLDANKLREFADNYYNNNQGGAGGNNANDDDGKTEDAVDAPVADDSQTN